jgi:transposase-like protein
MVHHQIIHCPHCEGTDLQKNGKSPEGAQRWFCKECRKYFRLEYRYNACKKGTKEEIINMTLNSSGARYIGRILRISKDTVTSVFKKTSSKTNPYLRYIPSGMHRIGKDNTWKIERKNLNFRTHKTVEQENDLFLEK